MLGLKPPQLRGEIFHSQDRHKPPAQAKQVIKSCYICASPKESTLSLGNHHGIINYFSRICLESAVCIFWFLWSEVGTRDHLIERRREAQLLRWGHFSGSWPALRLFSVWWGLGRGYWEVALRKHPPLMRPTQLEPVCPCAAALRPLAEATHTASRGSAGLHVQGCENKCFVSGPPA